MDRRFLAILAAIVLIFVGVFAFSQHSNNNSSSSGTVGTPTNHVEGLGQKGVTLIEYGDYECPVCDNFYQPLKQIASAFNSQIYFQFRNLPITSIHPNAFAGARAAEAAGLQNKYWQMHDALYENQSTWSTAKNPMPYFDTYAKNIGLNTSQFDSDYGSSKVNDSINADLDAFKKTGQEISTPAFFLDGKFLDNSQLVDTKTGAIKTDVFTQLINAEIASKR